MNLLEAASALDLSETSVRRRIRSGKLRAYRDGGRVIIEPADLERYKRECRLCITPPEPRASRPLFKYFPKFRGEADA